MKKVLFYSSKIHARKLLVTFVLAVLYLVYRLLMHTFPSPNMFLVTYLAFIVYIPVIYAAVSFGLYGGLICSLVIVIMNICISRFVVEDRLYSSYIRIAFDVSILFAGLGVGYVSFLNKKLKNALEEKNMLVREVQHRVRNNLALVSNIVQIKMMDEENPEIRETLEDISTRIFSIGLIHDKIYKTGNLKELSIRDYVESLSEVILNTLTGDDKEIELRIDIPDILMSVQTVVNLGVILNELITNSIKHGFKEKEKGVVEISLQKQKKYKLVFSNSGEIIPGSTNPLKSDTLGLKLVNAMVEQMNGKITFNRIPETRFEIAFK